MGSKIVLAAAILLLFAGNAIAQAESPIPEIDTSILSNFSGSIGQAVAGFMANVSGAEIGLILALFTAMLLCFKANAWAQTFLPIAGVIMLVLIILIFIGIISI